MKKILAILTTVALLSAFALTAAASEFKFYGSIRYNTISKDISPHNPNHYAYDKSATKTYEPVKSDRDTDWGLWGHSRVGAKIKLSDNLMGVFELGIGDGDLSVRHYYGEYDFGLGKILIGQTWHPSSVIASYSSQIWDAEDGLGEHGAFYGGRREMIKLSFGNFGLYLIEPKPIDKNFDDFFYGDSDEDFNSNVVFGQNDPERYGKKGDVDISIPQIAASYTFEYNNLTLEGMAAYQHYEFTDKNDTNSKTYGKTFDIDSHFFKIGAKVDLAPFTLAGSYGWGDNIGNMGLLAYSIFANGDGYTPIAIFSDGETLTGPAGIYDIETSGYTLVAGLKVNDMLSFETGYGHIENDASYWGYVKNAEAYSYYLQANIKIADGFVITPEIGKIEYGNLYHYEVGGATNPKYKFDGGDISYFGAKWQIDF